LQLSYVKFFGYFLILPFCLFICLQIPIYSYISSIKNENYTTFLNSSQNCIALMFGWPCIIVYQYSETNVMHFLFNLLRIKDLCMFRALLAHLHEALHKRHLVYCVRVMSAGCYQGWSGAPCRLMAACVMTCEHFVIAFCDVIEYGMFVPLVWQFCYGFNPLTPNDL
jgi:hypothetical protein